MEAFADVAVLSRIQFALTVAYHFLFVPLSIGLGLILAINETRYYRSRKPEDAAATKFWVKVFTATFAIGVATGITMEFSFGTNWANYSRFVGDIFGAPLAAEALFAFFLESVFLGVLLFGRERVSPKFYMVSSWLVWAGSCLSALWILIANSWMQTPAGAELNADGTEAVITDFFSAAFNPSIFARYTHTVDALLIMGAFVAMAVAGWYMLKGRNAEFAMKTMRIAAVVGIVTSCAMIVFAHSSAVVSVYALVLVGPEMDPNLGILRWLFVALVVVGLLASLVVGKTSGDDLKAFLAQSASMIALVALLACSMFPVLVNATADSVGPAITLANAASSELSLTWMTIILCIGLPLVLVYHVVIYRTFRGRVNPADLEEY